MSDLVPFGSSNYDFQARALEIARKYFFPDATESAAEQEAVSLLKSSLLGYVTEIFSDAFQDSVFHRDALLDEAFLNTAKLPRSIYNFAKVADYPVGFAIPASMPAVLSIDREEALKVAVDVDGVTKAVTVDSSRPFTAGEFPFRALRDIHFYFRYTGRLDVPADKRLASDYAVTVQYAVSSEEDKADALDGSKGHIPSPASPYLRTWSSKNPENGKTYVLAEMSLLQAERLERMFNVASTNLGENLFFNVPFSGGDICALDVYYKRASDAAFKKIPRFFNDMRAPSGISEWAYYGFRDDGSVDVYFSSLPDSFRPEINSQLKVVVHVTKGSEASFSYDGQISYTFPPGRLARLPVAAVAYAPSAGGMNRPTLPELKQQIVEYNLTRDSIISEIDINNYFRDLSRKYSFNGSKFLFMKKRDDVIRRIISVYAVVKGFAKDDSYAEGGRPYVVPTNTFDLVTSLAELDALSSPRVLPPGTQVIYDDFTDPDEPAYRLLRPGDVVAGKYVYSLPYLMVFRKDPYPRFVYYTTMVSSESKALFLDVNQKLPGEFILTGPITVQRDGSSDADYDLSFKVRTNISADRMDDVFCRALVVENADVPALRKVIGWIPFDPVPGADGNYDFVAKIATDDKFDSDYRISAVNSIRSVDNGILLPRTYVGQDVSLEISMMSETLTEGAVYKYKSFEGMNDDQADLASTLVTWKTESFQLYRNMSATMITDMVVSGFSGRTVLRAVPGVSSEFYSAPKNFEELYKLLSGFHTMLEEAKDKMEHNTDLDLKFYNTWGPSRFFDCGSTGISLSLSVRAKSSLTQAEDRELKDLVASMVEAANETGVFAYSNMARELETGLEKVAFVELNSIAGSSTLQVIRRTAVNPATMTPQQMIAYVPEWLNVATKADTWPTNPRAFVPDVAVEYDA